MITTPCPFIWGCETLNARNLNTCGCYFRAATPRNKNYWLDEHLEFTSTIHVKVIDVMLYGCIIRPVLMCGAECRVLVNRDIPLVQV